MHQKKSYWPFKHVRLTFLAEHQCCRYMRHSTKHVQQKLENASVWNIFSRKFPQLQPSVSLLEEVICYVMILFVYTLHLRFYFVGPVYENSTLDQTELYNVYIRTKNKRSYIGSDFVFIDLSLVSIKTSYRVKWGCFHWSLSNCINCWSSKAKA